MYERKKIRKKMMSRKKQTNIKKERKYGLSADVHRELKNKENKIK